jgi:O-antigen/teichoic acid export membrane protein
VKWSLVFHWSAFQQCCLTADERGFLISQFLLFGCQHVSFSAFDLLISLAREVLGPWNAKHIPPGYFTGQRFNFKNVRHPPSVICHHLALPALRLALCASRSALRAFSIVKHLIYRFSPDVLHAFYQRIEASPLGYRLAKGAFWSLAGSLISRGLGLLSAIIVGRILGKDDYGALGIIQNTIGMFGTLAGFGMGLTANKHVAEFKRTDPARAGRIIGTASLLAWASSGVMALALFMAAPWLATHTLAAPQLGGLLRAGALLLLLSGINGAQTGALSGFESFKEIARINIIAGLLSFPLMLLGAWRWGLTGVVWALISVQLANCLLCHRAMRIEAARFEIPIRLNSTSADRHLFWSFSLPAVLVGLLNSVVGWGAGALVVNQIGGYGDMGIYNAAMRVKGIPDSVLGLLVAPIIPMLSEAFGKGDHAAYQKTLRMFLLVSTLVVVPVSLMQAAAPQLTLLPFGSEYQGRPLIVSWLMLHAVLASMGTCAGYILVTAGRLWLLWLLSLSFAFCYAVFAMVLVPRYAAVGYAASLALAYAVEMTINAVVLYRNYPQMMRQARWGWLALLSLSLFAGCAIGSFELPFPWAVGLGILAAIVFVGLTLNALRDDFSHREKEIAGMSGRSGDSVGVTAKATDRN